MSMVSLRKSACVIAAVVFMGCCFEQVAFAQPGKKDAILNKDKKPASGKHWVWRDKKPIHSNQGVDGIIALVKPLENPNRDAEIKIWLYKKVAAPIPSGHKLELNEAYVVYLTDNEQVNSEKNTNKSFHYKVTTPITGANGQQDPTGGTRTFLITGTRERGNSNKSRTLRITTFTTKPQSPPNESPSAPVADDSEQVPSVAVFATAGPCTDYPDDAVLDEDEQVLTVESGVYQPDPTDDWMSVWP